MRSGAWGASEGVQMEGHRIKRNILKAWNLSSGSMTKYIILVKYLLIKNNLQTLILWRKIFFLQINPQVIIVIMLFFYCAFKFQ